MSHLISTAGDCRVSRNGRWSQWSRRAEPGTRCTAAGSGPGMSAADPGWWEYRCCPHRPPTTPWTRLPALQRAEVIGRLATACWARLRHLEWSSVVPTGGRPKLTCTQALNSIIITLTDERLSSFLDPPPRKAHLCIYFHGLSPLCFNQFTMFTNSSLLKDIQAWKYFVLVLLHHQRTENMTDLSQCSLSE